MKECTTHKQAFCDNWQTHETCPKPKNYEHPHPDAIRIIKSIELYAEKNNEEADGQGSIQTNLGQITCRQDIQ